MAVSKDVLIRVFTNAIRQGNAAIFGGAGLSRPSGFVDWKGLLKPLASEINLDVNKERDLLSVAQYYRNMRGTRCGINQAIIDAFSKDVATNENVKILTRLPISTYWTTNYDTIIESGIREANRNPDVKSESDQLTCVKGDRDAVVYKMHGDVNRPSNAVLTKEDYELYDFRRPLYRTALTGDLVSKVFLFIGFSFEDPNLDYILSQIHSLLGENVQDHYCFSKRVQESEYTDKSEYGYDKAKQEMQEENLRKYGIQTVFVDSYDKITEILREIEQAYKTRNVFISGSATEFPAPWNEPSGSSVGTNKAEEFAGKLAKALVRANYRITSGFGLGIGSSVVNGALDVIYAEKYRHIDKHLCLRPFPQNIADKDEREKRWRQYREDMLEDTGIAIFMFGNKRDKKSGKIVEADGCIEEYKIAKKKGNKIIPIGSTGGAAKIIFDKVADKIENYKYLEPYMTQLRDVTDIDKLVEIVIEIIRAQTV